LLQQHLLPMQAPKRHPQHSLCACRHGLVRRRRRRLLLLVLLVRRQWQSQGLVRQAWPAPPSSCEGWMTRNPA
jgi:hypothetical protein